MSSCLEHLLEHFPVGTAEGERQLLPKVYVKGDAFADLMLAPPGSPRILVGKKGTGKTALLQYASSVMQATKVPHLSLKPLDLDLESMVAGAAIAGLTRTAYNALLRSIAAELGTQQSGLLDGSDFSYTRRRSSRAEPSAT